MITRDEIIEIGVYNKPHGISGEISATFDYDIDMIKGLECFISDVNGIFVPFFAESIRTKNVTSVLMKLEGIEDDNSVKFLVNKEIYARKSDFVCDTNQLTGEDEDELPLDFFIGFKIVDTCGESIGLIENVDCATENYLFIVDDGDKQVFIPATDDFITNIDFENKVLEMDLPDGILEMN